MLPVDVAVDAIMANADHCESGGLYVYVKDAVDGSLEAESMDGLAAKVREYLLTLVPKPVLLSECEEGKWFTDTDGFPVRRIGDRVEYPSYTSVMSPDQVEVIQPVEVK